MPRYTFAFISNYNGVADYRLYIDGVENTRISARQSDLALMYSDRSPVLRAECDAFNAMIKAKYEKAHLAYPEFYQGKEIPVYGAIKESI